MFYRFSKFVADILGRPSAFILAVLSIIIWSFFGHIYNYSDAWQLVINTGTTIITFLMVFIIQHTQNRDTLAIQLKLDEMIRATKGARNELLKIEELSDIELGRLQVRYVKLAKKIKQKQHLKGKPL